LTSRFTFYFEFMKTLVFFQKICFLFCLAACSLSVNAQTVFISNEAELKAISNDLSANYRLINDIILTEEWTPIGKDKPFSGVLEGNHFVIRNLKINGGTGNVGFFAQTYGAFIQDLGFENVEIIAADATNVGAIIGFSTASYIENSYVSNALIEGNNVGSMIGLSKSRGINPTVISNSYAVADIKSGTAAGGIVAIAEGGTGAADGAAIEKVYFCGSVEAKTLCGGIVASTKGKNTVSDCLVVLSSELEGQATDPIVAKKGDNALQMSNNYFEKEGVLKDYAKNTPLSDTNVKSADFYKKRLYWEADKWNIRDGFYPLVSWQKAEE
jgi:hypothetical protein